MNLHDDIENEEFYEFYEELEAILNVAEEAKDIKMDKFFKVDIHVDDVSNINIDISVRNINVEFYPQGRSNYERMSQYSTKQGIAEGKSKIVVLQPSSIRREEFNIWRSKLKKSKQKNTNKYYLTTTKVNMK